MESSSLDPPSPSTPTTRPGLKGLSPPPRNSMEDADSSVTRKRPRLDSGDRAHRSMATVPASASASASASDPDPDPAQLGPEPSGVEALNKAPGHDARQAAVTPSKVTINLRDANLSSSPSQTASVATHPPHGDGGSTSSAAHSDLPELATSSPPPGDTKDTSREGSPEIEVADPEDLEGYDGPTVWRRGSGRLSFAEWQEMFIGQFPCLDNTDAPSAAFQALSQVLHRGDLQSGQLLSRIAEWIEVYIEKTKEACLKWFELFDQDQNFWESLPQVVEALLRRTTTAGLEHGSAARSEAGSPVEALLSAFVALTARTIHVDCETLAQSQKDPSDPELFAFAYIRTFAHLFGHRPDTHIWKTLGKIGYDHNLIIERVIMRFTAKPSGALDHLTESLVLLLTRNPTDPEIQKILTAMLDAVQAIAVNCERACGRVPAAQYGPVTTACFHFFKTIDAKLQSSISKQVSSLSYEFLHRIIDDLGQVLFHTINADESLATDILDAKYHAALTDPLVQDRAVQDRAYCAMMVWKTKIYRNCIAKGRMDSRIMGVEGLQALLVDVYQRLVRTRLDDGPPHVLVSYLCDYIVDTKLVEYLVSVDSHPQLMQRSKNIIGFLVVTRRYSHAETDKIWTAAVSSQDHRTADAILDMLAGILDLAHVPELLYFCQKIDEVPPGSFDQRIMHFCGSVLHQVRFRWRQEPFVKIDPAPYRLLIRLLRQVVSDAGVPRDRRREVWHFAVQELRNLQDRSLKEADRLSIYGECFDDISRKSPAATGSITTINLLLDGARGPDLRGLASTFDVTGLVVMDFARLAEIEASIDLSLQDFGELLADRLLLVEKTILQLSDTLTPDLTLSLWNAIVGERALGSIARDAAWAMLGRVASQSTSPNSFLDRCLNEHLPRLNPTFFTRASLEFAYKVMLYEERTADLTRLETESNDEVLIGELFWHLSITAPDPEVGSKAIETLVKHYVEGINVRPRRSSLDELHAHFIDRCIQELINAAAKLKRLHDGTCSGEDDSMVIVPADEDVAGAKLRFVRPFAILNEFMRNIRTGLPDPPISRGDPQGSPHSADGEKVSIRYQSHANGKAASIRSLEVGSLTNVAQLMARLGRLTGFSSFNVFVGGTRFDQVKASASTISDTNLQNRGLLLIHKAAGSEPTNPGATVSGFRPLESEVMQHFHDLYELLALDDDLGKTVFDFLAGFPPHEDTIALVTDVDQPAAHVFSVDAPFKTLYSNTISHTFIGHSVHILADALALRSFPDGHPLPPVEIMTDLAIVECLLAFLKEPVPVDVPAKYFNHPATFVDGLRQLLMAAQSSPETQQTVALIQACFATLLEASIHNRSVWQYFREHQSSAKLLQDLLLHSPSVRTREVSVAAVRGVCAALPTMQNQDSPGQVSAAVEHPGSQEFMAFFWKHIEANIPRTVDMADQAEQFYTLASEIFRRLDDAVHNSLPLASYLKTWSELLLEFRHEEYVGRESTDWVVMGLSSLLHWCMVLMRSTKKPLEVDENLLERVFKTHLFPEVPPWQDRASEKACVPVLNSSTRSRIYAILMVLGNDMRSYKRLLALVKNVLPEGDESQAWSRGLAQLSEEYSLEANWNFERSKAVRSPTGYCGLRNLSNTCYMNSLLTQLFMNPGFREFMLTTPVTDGTNSQRLLFETKRLFGYAQESWLKAVDTQCIADSVITYDQAPIDVSVQMDVDEFYNLLFDRWESQLASSADKKRFRSFYGGQLVQQIKSQECSHISERLEPFSAIQCEIQGKRSLTESLSAYIEGEVMEGDNKYNCSACGSYVNAVKRACLKDIPDNLIFHLKRFDYDLVTGMRSKINDYFEFPDVIDMAPYDVEYLQDTRRTLCPDNFILVGVLVHSGNAEVGHYYSYIRERPNDSHSWVEFNDMEVSAFDRENMKEQCFGGWQDQYMSGGLHCAKVWSAYMLFYQRASSLAAEKQQFCSQTLAAPVKVGMPAELGSLISFENENWIRKYCLYDGEHAIFIEQLLNQYRNLSKGVCSADHTLEGDVMSCAWQHLEQIFCRDKERPRVDSILNFLGKMTERCAHCCWLSLSWLMGREQGLRNLLLKMPDEALRKRMSLFVVKSLASIKLVDPAMYGLDAEGSDDGSASSRSSRSPGAFFEVINALKELQLVLPLHTKAWDDFYGLLLELASTGPFESAVMHRAGFLQHCLEILVLEPTKRYREAYPEHIHYFRLFEKRRFSFRKMLAFLASLLKTVKLDLETTESWTEAADTVQTVHGNALSRQEHIILQHVLVPPGENVKILAFLDKAINNDVENTTAAQSIVRTLLRAESKLLLQKHVYDTIVYGTMKDPAQLAAPYLNAAVAFCESCPSAESIKSLIKTIASGVRSIGATGGEEHLNFFIKLRRSRNQAAFGQRYDALSQLMLQAVPHFAPHLLTYPDSVVRENTVDLLRTIVFEPLNGPTDDEQAAEKIGDIFRKVYEQCLLILEEVVQEGKAVDSAKLESLLRVTKYCQGEIMGRIGEASEEEQEIYEKHSRLIQEAQSLMVTTDDLLSDDWANESESPASETDSDTVYLSDRSPDGLAVFGAN